MELRTGSLYEAEGKDIPFTRILPMVSLRPFLATLK
jgi:hypothetical protein